MAKRKTYKKRKFLYCTNCQDNTGIFTLLIHTNNMFINETAIKVSNRYGFIFMILVVSATLSINATFQPSQLEYIPATYKTLL